MLSFPAVRALRSLDVVSCSVLPVARAGSFEGGLSPEGGRMFSIWDNGRSIHVDVVSWGAVAGCKKKKIAQCRMRMRVQVIVAPADSSVPSSTAVVVKSVNVCRASNG